MVVAYNDLAVRGDRALQPSGCLVVIDLQKTFNPPRTILQRVGSLAARMYSVATVERHDEATTPFQAQLGWTPAIDDESLVPVNRVFVKHGYLPGKELIDHLKLRNTARAYVCGMQADTCVLAAGFALFDAGLHPTLLIDLVIGSSLDRSGELGVRLWRHHFGATITSDDLLSG